MAKSIEDNAEKYAIHLCGLLNESNSWMLRRVVSVSVVDADTLSVRVSIDFDLEQSAAGRTYLEEVKRHYPEEAREREEDLALLVPIGIYPSPYVCFNLRNSAETRLSLITGPTRRKLKAAMLASQADIPDWIRRFLSQGEVAFVLLNSDYWSGRHVIHCSYMTRWKMVGPYKFDPDLDPPSLGSWRDPFKRFWAQITLTLHPAKATMRLLHPTLSRTFHIEFAAPEGVRVYRAEILEPDGLPVKIRNSVGDLEEIPLQRDLPPAYGHVFYTYDGCYDKGAPMLFRVWLGLDRRGLPSTARFLIFLNLLVIAIAIVPDFVPFSRLYGGEAGQVGTNGALVTAQLITAGLSFAYLQLPGEHGLARSLYSPLRWLLAISAMSVLFTALLVAVKPSHISVFDTTSIIFGIVASIALALAHFIYRCSNGRWIEKWVSRHKDEEHYGRHAMSYTRRRAAVGAGRP